MSDGSHGTGGASAEPRQAVGRLPSGILAVGAALYIVGDLFDVVGVLPNLYGLEDDAARLEALQTHAGAYTAENVLSAVGLVVAAFGLWLFGLAVRGAAEDNRTRLLAGLVAWAGVATAAWAVDAVTKLGSSAQDIVEGLTDPPAQVVFAGLVYVVAVVIAFVALGLVLLRLRHQRWLSWLLFVGAAVGCAAMLFTGPSLIVTVLLVAGLTLAIAPPRHAS